MWKYCLKKIVELAVVLLLISFFPFAVILYCAGRYFPVCIFSQEMTDEQKEAVLEHLGMDKSMPEQYLGWLKQAVKGDFGVSLANRTSVTPQILSRLPATLLLMGTALFCPLYLRSL